jgi:hypothetical protein
VDFTKSLILVATIVIASVNWFGVRNRSAVRAEVVP